MIRQSTEIRVRYADTDQMKSIHHAAYLEYFEEGRSDLMRTIGLPYSEVEHLGFYLPVIEVYAKYRRSAAYDEVLTVETMISELPVARVRIDYKIYREGENEPIATGYTVHGFINSATGKPTRAPAMVLQFFEEAFAESKETHAEERAS